MYVECSVKTRMPITLPVPIGVHCIVYYYRIGDAIPTPDPIRTGTDSRGSIDASLKLEEQNNNHMAIVFQRQSLHDDDTVEPDRPTFQSRSLLAKYHAMTAHERLVAGLAHYDSIPAATGPISCTQNQPVLCRIHSACFTGETIFSARCDCGDQLRQAMELMARQGEGVLVYLRQEGRGIGLEDKLKY